MYVPSLISIPSHFPRYGQDKQPLSQGEITLSIYRVMMSIVVLKLFAEQGTGQTDGQSGDYMLPHLESIIQF